MSNPTKTPGAGEELPSEPRYAAAEPQPQSAISERDALAEREDGTIRGGTAQSDFSGQDSPPKRAQSRWSDASRS
jgi:hypothetical protein